MDSKFKKPKYCSVEEMLNSMKNKGHVNDEFLIEYYKLKLNHTIRELQIYKQAIHEIRQFYSDQVDVLRALNELDTKMINFVTEINADELSQPGKDEILSIIKEMERYESNLHHESA